MFVKTLSEFRADRYAAAIATRNILFWYIKPDVRVVSAWGLIDREDVELIIEGMTDELAPGFRRFSSLVDMTEIERIDPDSFSKFFGFMRDNIDAFSAVNRRSAYVHGDGNQLATSAVSGYTNLIGNPFPTENFSEIREGFAYLGYSEEADALTAQLGELKAEVRAEFQMLLPLHDAISRHRRSPTGPNIAAELEMSTRTLQRELSAIGTSLSAEVRRVRVNLVKKLLLTTKLTIVEIAAETGFGSVKTLRSAFQSELGASPAAWRDAQKR